jgi:hypothetical protein
VSEDVGDKVEDEMTDGILNNLAPSGMLLTNLRCETDENRQQLFKCPTILLTSYLPEILFYG